MALRDGFAAAAGAADVFASAVSLGFATLRTRSGLIARVTVSHSARSSSESERRRVMS